MKQKPKEIKLIVHHSVDDPDCDEDYCSVDMVIDGEVVEKYGAAYHDSGMEKCEGFYDALVFVYGKKIPVMGVENVADIDW